MLVKLVSYVPAIAGLIAMGLIVFLNNRKAAINLTYFAFTTSAAIWLSFLYLADITSSQSIALLGLRFALASGLIMSFSFFLFAQHFVVFTPINRFIRIAYLSIFVFLTVACFTPLIIPAVNLTSNGAQPTGIGLGYTLLNGFVFLGIASGVSILIYKYRKAKAAEKNQLSFVLAGAFIAISVNVAINYFLTIYLPQAANYSLAGFSVLVMALCFAYVIIWHRLFNIRSIVARSLAYILSIAAFAFLYAFLAFGLAQGVFLKNILTTERSQQIFNVILAVILAFTFPWIRRFFQRITDRVFYRDRYDPQELVSDIGRVLASEIELEKVSLKVLDILQTQMRLDVSNIVVLSKNQIFYQARADKIQQIYHPADLAIFKSKLTITDELPNGDKRETLERHNVRAIFPLKTTESFVGYLLLGEKKSGDIFSEADIQTLHIIADELAIAIQNARSYQEIQRFNETLREKVRQATAELRHANSELKELDKAKDEFISMASHQLRTPLTAVRGYTSMVMDGDFGRITGEQKETLKQSFDAATRMTRLVDDLLNVSRIQSGKFKIERTAVDLNKVVPEEVSLIETTASTKSVKVTFHAPDKPVPVLQIDEGKTRQCLMNLMDNAIYYSSSAEGGGKVDVYLESDGTSVSFRVQDNGIGVPKAEQPKLFKKFYRAPNAQQARPDGTGLGLFLVGRVVHDQGGEIIFESEEGKGSTFGFRLPVKATEPAAAEPTKAASPTPA